MTDSISRDPYDRFGPYKSLGDVPPCHRLESYRQRYEGVDSWGRFMARELVPQHNSYQTELCARLAGHRWKGHMASTSRHHALARPTDIETGASPSSKTSHSILPTGTLVDSRAVLRMAAMAAGPSAPLQPCPHGGGRIRACVADLANKDGFAIPVMMVGEDVVATRDRVATAFDRNTDPLAAHGDALERLNVDPLEKFVNEILDERDIVDATK